MKTTGDWCQQTPYIGSHGGPVGVTVFVAVNCDVGWPLGFCWQDPAYLNAGVSHNESVYNDYLDVHQDFDMNKPVEWTPTVWCEEEEQGYSQGGIPPGCTAGLPSGISLAVYTPPPTA
jgi:hypothetical protein